MAVFARPQARNSPVESTPHCLAARRATRTSGRVSLWYASGGLTRRSAPIAPACRAPCYGTTRVRYAPASTLRQPAFLRELLQVRFQGQRRRGAQLRRGVGPGAVEELVRPSQAVRQGGQQALLAVQAVRDVLVELGSRVPDVGAVPGADDLEVELAQAPQGSEVRGHRALARRYEDAARSEHGVTREADPPLHQADVVRRVPGRGERVKRAHLVPLARADDRRAGELGQRLGALRVVGMAVGEHDA